MSEIRISLLIPAYNTRDYVGNLIEDCLHQDIPQAAYEIIIVNDGSKDDTLEVIESYAAKYPNIRVISQENKGCGESRNVLIQAAQGKYFWFLDSDDHITHNCLGNILTVLEADSLDVLCIRLNDDQKLLPELPQEFDTAKEYSSVITGPQYLLSAPSTIESGSVWSCIFNAAWWQKHQFKFQRIKIEDMQVKQFAISKAEKLRYLQTSSFYYYDTSRIGSIVNSKPNQSYLHTWAYTANTYFEHAQEEPSAALSEFFYAVATHAYTLGIGILHKMGCGKEDVRYYFGLLHHLPRRKMKFRGSLYQRVTQNVVLYFPYTYFKIRRGLLRLRGKE